MKKKKQPRDVSQPERIRNIITRVIPERPAEEKKKKRPRFGSNFRITPKEIIKEVRKHRDPKLEVLVRLHIENTYNVPTPTWRPTLRYLAHHLRTNILHATRLRDQAKDLGFINYEAPLKVLRFCMDNKPPKPGAKVRVHKRSLVWYVNWIYDWPYLPEWWKEKLAQAIPFYAWLLYTERGKDYMSLNPKTGTGTIEYSQKIEIKGFTPGEIKDIIKTIKQMPKPVQSGWARLCGINPSKLKD